jgi:cytochrome c5
MRDTSTGEPKEHDKYLPSEEVAQGQKKEVHRRKRHNRPKTNCSSPLHRSKLHLLQSMKKSLCTLLAVYGVFAITAASEIQPGAPDETAQRGRNLFERNCAHCHGDDAHGDEGPDLHNLKKSDARITKVVTQGIKGEMPAFGTKLKEADVKALIAFLRTLN